MELYIEQKSQVRKYLIEPLIYASFIAIAAFALKGLINSSSDLYKMSIVQSQESRQPESEIKSLIEGN